MNKDVKIETGWREYQVGGLRLRMKVQYGFSCLSGQSPYFGLTANTERHQDGRWREGSSGAMEIGAVYPELAFLAKWHLTGTEQGVGLHYRANGLYWLGQIDKPKTNSWDPDPLESFHSTCLYGVLPDDKDFHPEHESLNKAGKWLDARLPALRQLFLNDMKRIGFDLTDPLSPKIAFRLELKNVSKSAPSGLDELAAQAGIEFEAEQTDRNPNMQEAGPCMDHWICKLRRRIKGVPNRTMQVHFSKGLGHNGKPPELQEVLDCLASDCGTVESSRDFTEWANDLGYEVDSRSAEKIYRTVLKQARRLKAFLGEDFYRSLI